MGWQKCINPNCKGRYHTNKKKVVDIPCKCQAKSLVQMRNFNHKLSGG